MAGGSGTGAPEDPSRDDTTRRGAWHWEQIPDEHPPAPTSADPADAAACVTKFSACCAFLGDCKAGSYLDCTFAA